MNAATLMMDGVMIMARAVAGVASLECHMPLEFIMETYVGRRQAVAMVALENESREWLPRFAEFHASCEKYVATSLDLILKHNHGANDCDNEQWIASQGNSEKMHVLHVTSQRSSDVQQACLSALLVSKVWYRSEATHRS